eukprot:Skav231661  [mRNA]  locus=scaffold823:182260:186903:- [translate_table: standard]
MSIGRPCEELQRLLRQFDIEGMGDGASNFNDRKHVMISDASFYWEGDQKMLKGTQVLPEGSSAQQFVQGNFMGQADRTVGSGPILIAWTTGDATTVLPKTLLLWNLQDAFHQWRGDQADFVYDQYSLLLPFHEGEHDSLHVFEPYGGGYGGWSFAGRFIQKHTKIPFQFATVEADFQAIQHFASQHDCIVWDGSLRIPHDALEGIAANVAIHASVTQDTWKEALTNWGIDIMTVSAPCPPWSNASNKAGLRSSDGILLPLSFLLLRQLRPKAVVIEQVKGFGSHPQKQHVLDCLKHVGYKLCWSRVIDAAGFGGSTRSRWLGLAIRIHAHDVDFTRIDMWPRISQLTPQTIGAILPEHMLHMDSLRIDDEVYAIGSNFNMLPPASKAKMQQATPAQVWASRCSKATEVAQTFMSKYGQQHRFEVRILEEKGYLGHFVTLVDHEGRTLQRFYHPMEIMMTHLTVDAAFIAKDLIESWTHIGNCICLPHSLLLLANVTKCFAQHRDSIDVEQLFVLLQHEAMNSTNLTEVMHELGTVFVDPRMLTMQQQAAITVKLDHVASLKVKFESNELPPGWIWTPTKGLVTLQELRGGLTGVESASQVTLASVVEVPETIEFVPVIKVLVEIQDLKFFLWINGEVAPAALCELFQLPLKVESLPSNPEGLSFKITAMEHINLYNAPWLSKQGFSFGIVPLVQQDALTVVKLNPTLSCDEAAKQFLQSLGADEWFDQFGDVTEHLRVTHATAFFPEPLQHTALHTDTCFLVAASQMVRGSAVWDITQACLTFKIVGDETAVEVIKQLWLGALVEDSLKMVNQHVTCQEMPGEATFSFRSIPDSFLLPCDTLKECLQIAATRRILDAKHTREGVPITLRWNSRVLWKGQCDPRMTAEALLALLEPVFAPFLGQDSVRLICKGRVCYAITLEELMRPSSSSLVFHLQFGTAGGGGEKTNLRTYVKNTVAATLLEHGYPFQWTASTADQLLDLIGVKQMSQIVAMPQGQARLDQILQSCRNSAITIPDRIATEAMKVNTKGTQLIRDKKRQIVQPNPDNYYLEMSFLRNEDGTTPIQLTDVSPQKSGLVLVSLQQAQAWIKEARLLTKDELTLAIVGHHQLATTLHTEQCNLPCTDLTGRPVILAATLCHLGEKRITPVSNPKKVDEKECQSIAMTLWKDDWSDTEWTRALDHTFAFVKAILVDNAIDTTVESMWGRSIRGENKQRSSSLHAVSIQIHVAVQKAKVLDFLRATGFCKLYATPKGKDGRACDQWRIIWVDGDRARLHSLATQTSSCAGLVRNRQTWGLRFPATEFAAAWKVINGDKVPPNDIQVKYMFRIEPLPYGCTATMLGEWSQLLSWPFKAIKALGPRCWLVGSAVQPPDGIHTFNTCPVIIKLIPPKGLQETSPILAGPKPSKAATKEGVAAPDPHFDPWAKAAHAQREANAASQQARTLQGPTEARFQAQDERMAQMENTLQQLQSNQDKLRSDTEKGFAAVEKQEQKLHHAIHQVRTDLENSFSAALSAQSNQLNATLADLKNLLQAKPKRGLPKGEEEMESD